MTITKLKLLPGLIVALLAAALGHSFFIGTANGQDAIPKLINYQGRLTDSAGQSLSNGTYVVRFELFDAKSASSNLIWGAQYTLVAMSGQFNVVLGAAGGISVAGAAVNDIGFALGGGNRHLQLTILTDNTGTNNLATPLVLSPRQQLLSTPYALNGVPAGSVMPFAGTNVPAGWRLCDGSTVNAATNSAYLGLLTAIGKTYGVGDGTSLSFNLPDLRGRTVAGKDDMGGTVAGRITASGTGNPGIPGTTLGAAGGVDRLTLNNAQMPNHNHGGSTATAGSHTHTVTITYYRAQGDNGNGTLPGHNSDPDVPSTINHTTASAGNHSHSIPSDGGSEAFPEVQPTIILNYIIKL